MGNNDLRLDINKESKSKILYDIYLCVCICNYIHRYVCVRSRCLNCIFFIKIFAIIRQSAFCHTSGISSCVTSLCQHNRYSSISRIGCRLLYILRAKKKCPTLRSRLRVDRSSSARLTSATICHAQ